MKKLNTLLLMVSLSLAHVGYAATQYALYNFSDEPLVVDSETMPVCAINAGNIQTYFKANKKVADQVVICVLRTGNENKCTASIAVPKLLSEHNRDYYFTNLSECQFPLAGKSKPITVYSSDETKLATIRFYSSGSRSNLHIKHHVRDHQLAIQESDAHILLLPRK